MKVFVTAKPNAKEEYIKEAGESRFIIAVKEPPEEGKANAALLRVLARHFGIARSRVELIRGSSSRRKVFEIV